MNIHSIKAIMNIMNDLSYNNWPALSDAALAAQIGAYIRHHRLLQSKSQDDLSHAAGISRSTLSLLERGETVTLGTLIRVLRVLDQWQVMDAFVVPRTISPLALAKAERKQRKRAARIRH
jgi:transcriptional regulator with XRE-family HTH domain